MLSVILLAVLLVPALQALQTGIIGAPTASGTEDFSSLTTKVEEVLAAPFSKVYGETYAAGGNTTASVSPLFSDPAGALRRRVVVLYRYDALLRTLAITDTGLVYVKVYYEAEGPVDAINVLIGRWW